MEKLLVKGFEAIDHPAFKVFYLQLAASCLPNQEVLLQKIVQTLTSATKGKSVLDRQQFTQKTAENSVWQVQQRHNKLFNESTMHKSL